MTFLTKPRKNHVPVILISDTARLPDVAKDLAAQIGFKAEAGQILILRNAGGAVSKIFAGISSPISIHDMAATVAGIRGAFADGFIKKTSFELKGKKADMDIASLGWAMGNYRFDRYKDKKTKSTPRPALVMSIDADKKRVKALSESMIMLRDLVNTPTIDMGPANLEEAVRGVAEAHKAKIKVVKGKALERDFPLVHTVGMAASDDRYPRFIELNWGNAKHPKLSLVGKGVCFDTGGLDIKPSAFMKLMKKDMGGAAHALALANIVMALKLPVRLQLLIPAVENAISGNSFRPSDVFTSRKGITVENTNTDAEGRLILADALTYASEGKPDLIIDFATLTGSARAALGMDIPAAFCNDDDLRSKLNPITEAAEDMVWAMPLHQPYKARNKSNVAEMQNSAGVAGDLIYSGLFLESFLVDSPRWVHIDCFAWEQFGTPFCPVGGKDTGLRGMLAVVEQLYS